MNSILEDDVVLCIPTVPHVAPKLNQTKDEINASWIRINSLTCIAGFSECPEVFIFMFLFFINDVRFVFL